MQIIRLITSAAILLLVACGQKGALVLNDPAKPTSAKPPPKTPYNAEIPLNPATNQSVKANRLSPADPIQ